jgi:hypothetical protein
VGEGTDSGGNGNDGGGMSKAKISAWPWKIHPTHNKIEIQDANAQPVAVVWSGEMRHGGHSKSRYMNARLLALAPKLLEECGNALRVLWRIKNPDVGCTCTTDGHYCAVCTIRDLEGIVALAYEIPDEFTVDPWCHKETHDGRAIDPSGDRTLTPGEGEKCQPKSTSPVLTAGASGNARLVKETPPDFPTANGGKAELPKPDPTVKPDVTVDAIRADVTVAIARINGLAKWIEDLESRLAAKPAARVVKAPRFAPSRVFSDAEQAVIGELHRKWYAALTSQGITVADDNSTQH